MLLAALGLLTWRQSRMYADMETLWRTTIARNPDCWLAQNDLGAVLYEKGQVDQAILLFRKPRWPSSLTMPKPRTTWARLLIKRTSG
jgi:Flp pilus assembly protein TadD